MSRPSLPPTLPSFPRLRTALALLTALASSGAYALGFGDLRVESTLGAPFSASVALNDVPAALAVDCFRADSAQLPGARLALERTPTGTQRLRISSRRPLDVPFTEIVLTHTCGEPLRRDYVALIDPPDFSGVAASPVPVAQADPPVARRQPPAAPVRHTARRAPAPEPHLVLSTETGDDTRAATPADAPPSATDLDDRMVALERHAEDLAARLSALRLRNAELDAQLAALAPPPSPEPRWNLMLLMLGLLAGSAGGAVLLSRSRHAPPLDHLPHPSPANSVSQALHAAASARLADQGPVAAIRLLENQLRDNPNASAAPWLLLLDLLRQNGNDDDYLATLRECKRRFNVDLEQTSRPDTQGLESYSHVIGRLAAVWSTPERALALTDKLLHDSRDGIRQGFSREAFDDLLTLDALARARAAT